MAGAVGLYGRGKTSLHGDAWDQRGTQILKRWPSFVGCGRLEWGDAGTATPPHSG